MRRTGVANPFPMSEMLKLAGKKVVIIGGSSGMGLASAKAVAREGAEVVIASRSREKLEAARAQVGGKVEVRPLDITDEQQVRRFFEEVGAIDHLVLPGSGEAVLGRFAEVDAAAAQRFMESKFWGPARCARLGAPHIRPGGSITFFSGAASRRASPDGAYVSAINAAVETLGNTLAVELAPIRVNTIAPGLIETPVWDELMPRAERDAMFRAMSERLPARRIGRPEDVADAVLFLLRNTYTTGTVLFVDGGYVQA